jgi:hypothetical protein
LCSLLLPPSPLTHRLPPPPPPPPPPAAALAAGESGAIRLLQYGGIARDAARGALLTGLGLLAAWAVARGVQLDRQTAVGLTLVAIGTALAAAASGAVRSAGRGARLRWLAAGVAAGTLLAVLR